MNEQQLVRTLNSVGMRCFIAWFRQFCDPSLSNEDVAAVEHVEVREGGALLFHEGQYGSTG
jgi:hypothetical protein